MTPEYLKAMCLFLCNVEKYALVEDGVIHGGEGSLSWDRFNRDFITFVIKLPQHRLMALTNMINRQVGARTDG